MKESSLPKETKTRRKHEMESRKVLGLFHGNSTSTIELNYIVSKGCYPQTVSQGRFGLVRRSCLKWENRAPCVFMDMTISPMLRIASVMRVSHDGIKKIYIPADDWTVT